MELDINNVIALKDNRTTLMIKNIPNKFNKDLLLNIIDQNFKGTYDLFILPTDAAKILDMLLLTLLIVIIFHIFILC